MDNERNRAELEKMKLQHETGKQNGASQSFLRQLGGKIQMMESMMDLDQKEKVKQGEMRNLAALVHEQSLAKLNKKHDRVKELNAEILDLRKITG